MNLSSAIYQRIVSHGQSVQCHDDVYQMNDLMDLHQSQKYIHIL